MQLLWHRNTTAHSSRVIGLPGECLCGLLLPWLLPPHAVHLSPPPALRLLPQIPATLKVDTSATTDAGVVTMVVTITNTGGVDATGVAFDFTMLPSEVAWAVDIPECTLTDGIGACAFGDLVASGTVTITITGTTTSSVNLAGTVAATNVATCDPSCDVTLDVTV